MTNNLGGIRHPLLPFSWSHSRANKLCEKQSNTTRKVIFVFTLQNNWLQVIKYRDIIWNEWAVIGEKKKSLRLTADFA